MLIFVRYANLILLLVIMIGLLLAFSVIITRFFDSQRGKNKNKKGKSGELPTDAGIRDLLIENRIDEAIELYRRFTGVDMYTAQIAVEDMLREIRLGILKKEYKKILRKQGKAAAIEAYQTQTGADLAEALTYIEAIEKG